MCVGGDAADGRTMEVFRAGDERMTRDEWLDMLRRELSNRAWEELRPGERLAEVESRLDRLSEAFTDVRAEYDEASGEELLRALDDLAASASYLRSDVGQLFSQATRLASDLRSALRNSDDEAAAEQLVLEPGEGGESAPADASPDETEASSESGGDVRQGSLFGD